jgi:Icc-related predicted phosphoesterase
MVSKQNKKDKWNEGIFQGHWILDNAEKLRKWIGEKKLLIIPGNHDFIDPTGPLQEIGICTISLNETCFTDMGLTFYGFPYIPWIGDYWNFELRSAEMSDKVEQLGYIVEDNRVDVLVAHSPIAGILDFTGPEHGSEHIGSTVIGTAISYRWKRIPRLYLHGHAHGSPGISNLNGMIVSNSARTLHFIEIEPEG